MSVSSSPGSTIRLKRTSSIPAKSASLPRFSSSESAAIAPACASASTMITPGMIGRPGKCPGKNHSSPRTRLRATTRTPGSSSSTSSRKRNGSRCGMISSITSRPNGAVGVIGRAARAASSAPVRVALGRPDGHPRPCGDLLERPVERVLEHDHACLVGRDRGQLAGQLGAKLREASARAGSASSPPMRRSSKSGSHRRDRCRVATSRQVFTTRRWSHVPNCASPRNWRMRTQSFASDSWAASRASSGSASR